MKTAVIGGGISGLAIAQMLKGKDDVIVFEAEDRPGGIIKCDRINGNLFHRTGGHVFNTKRQDVMDWFWKHFDKEQEFTKAIRNSAVHIDGDFFVPYPIENHSYMFGKEIQKSIINDWLLLYKMKDNEPQNFSDFLKKRFGETLFKIYFEPYNTKVWRKDLSNVPLDWLEGKLPMPTIEEMIFNNMNHIEEKSFVHSSFFYPKQGGAQFIANRLSEGLNIVYNSKIEKISFDKGFWNIKGQKFDQVIYTGNIKFVPSLLADEVEISDYKDKIEKLEYHGTTAVFCEIDKNDYSWLYMPSKEHLSHRIICTGNFSETNNVTGTMTATIEFTDAISIKNILENLKKIPFHPRYITHHYEKYTYPIQNKDTRDTIKSLNRELGRYHFHLLGRFAQWEYNNMDVCIGECLDFANKNK